MSHEAENPPTRTLKQRYDDNLEPIVKVATLIIATLALAGSIASYAVARQSQEVAGESKGIAKDSKEIASETNQRQKDQAASVQAAQVVIVMPNSVAELIRDCFSGHPPRGNDAASCVPKGYQVRNYSALPVTSVNLIWTVKYELDDVGTSTTFFQAETWRLPFLEPCTQVEVGDSVLSLAFQLADRMSKGQLADLPNEIDSTDAARVREDLTPSLADSPLVNFTDASGAKWMRGETSPPVTTTVPLINFGATTPVEPIPECHPK